MEPPAIISRNVSSTSSSRTCKYDDEIIRTSGATTSRNKRPGDLGSDLSEVVVAVISPTSPPPAITRNVSSSSSCRSLRTTLKDYLLTSPEDYARAFELTCKSNYGDPDFVRSPGFRKKSVEPQEKPPPLSSPFSSGSPSGSSPRGVMSPRVSPCRVSSETSGGDLRDGGGAHAEGSPPPGHKKPRSEPRSVLGLRAAAVGAALRAFFKRKWGYDDPADSTVEIVPVANSNKYYPPVPQQPRKSGNSFSGPSLAPGFWFYIDAESRKKGPFSGEQMRSCYEKQKIQADTPVTCSTFGGDISNSNAYFALSSVFPELRTCFWYQPEKPTASAEETRKLFPIGEDECVG